MAPSQVQNDAGLAKHLRLSGLNRDPAAQLHGQVWQTAGSFRGAIGVELGREWSGLTFRVETK
jgi:hypothetical protein